jgi:Fe-S oxidoreductase
MEVISPFKEAQQEIRQSGGEPSNFCFQCGKCDTLCPWNRVTTFSVRKLMREASLGVVEIEKEEVWRCTTCGKCPLNCPRDVRQIENMVALRRVATNYDVYPASVKSVRRIMACLTAQGNPFGEERSERGKWAEGLGVKEFTEGTEYLYFPCCYPCYDARLKRVARAVASLLNKAGVDFGILGSKENCCGESIRKTGNEELFKQLAKEEIKVFIDNGVRKIICSSPHCYHTFKNEYPYFGVNFQVIHITQFLLTLLEEGRLKINGSYSKVVTYHDPCYLGRHNGIYEEPRSLLKSIPGLQLVEMREIKEESLCCGMGGGRVWMETPKEERFANLRIQQALDTGAEVLATACPYCITAFEDARVVLNLEDRIEVKDVTEILDEVTI